MHKYNYSKFAIERIEDAMCEKSESMCHMQSDNYKAHVLS